MKKLALLAAGALAAGALFVAPANASDGSDPCGSDGWPAVGVINIAGVAYVDDRNFALGHGLWIYAETNGQGGLQRGGTSPLGADLGGSDSCVESDNPDTIIF